ncbi:MAG: hypothetical protein IKF37_02245 [Bacilli bacterium]|nr:hypothetical protein [Bacilli bacterium]
MQFIEDYDFNELVDEFKKLSTNEKRELTINEMKSLLAALSSLNSIKSNDVKILFNHEVIDLNKENYTEDDYIEAIYTYIFSIKELLADFILNSSENNK